MSLRMWVVVMVTVVWALAFGFVVPWLVGWPEGGGGFR